MYGTFICLSYIYSYLSQFTGVNVHNAHVISRFLLMDLYVLLCFVGNFSLMKLCCSKSSINSAMFPPSTLLFFF